MSIPISELTRNGELDLYPEVAGKGYFDIDYSKGALTLRSTRYVGLIPVNERVAIHVTPKAPIANLLWLVSRAGAQLSFLEGVVRSYEDVPGTADDPETLYLNVFLSALQRIHSRSPVKRYTTREVVNAWRGRIQVAQSIGRFYGRGTRSRHVFAQTDLTVDCSENRILKHVARRMVRHLVASSDPACASLARAMGRHLERFTLVDDTAVSDAQIARQMPILIRGLPSMFSYYEPALWLAYLIAARSGVVMERVGSARFESVLINVSTIFESYVRQLCKDASKSLACHVHDGNNGKLRLFIKGAGVIFPARPDIIFSRRHDRQGRIAIADAKYKSCPSRDDRYELISHAEATGVKHAMFICPTYDGITSTEHYGTTLGGLRIDLIKIDLAARDLASEEQGFVQRVHGALADASHSAPSSDSVRSASGG